MNETVETRPTNQLPAITAEFVKRKITIALTAQQLFITRMQEAANTLVFNEQEENIAAIKLWLENAKKVEDAITLNHTIIKKPYWDGATACDIGKRELLAITSPMIKSVAPRYAKLCTDLQDKKRKQEEEDRHEKMILDGIEANVIDFSTRISLCETGKELLAVELSINQQKSPSSAGKYGKFHIQAIAKFDEVLKPIIVLQKERLKEKLLVDAELKAAEKVDDIEKIETLTARAEAIDEHINHNKAKVQEAALYSSPVVSAPSGYARAVFTEVKAKRGTWEVELVSVDAAVKGARQYLKIELDKTLAKENLKTLIEAGRLDNKNKTEVIVDGIKYYFKQTWS